MKEYTVIYVSQQAPVCRLSLFPLVLTFQTYKEHGGWSIRKYTTRVIKQDDAYMGLVVPVLWSSKA
jgi:hypothetical protein